MKKHYLDLKDQPFYQGLCKYMSSGPVLAMVTHTHTDTHTLRQTHTHISVCGRVLRCGRGRTL